MKSPAELAQRLARQWENPDLREDRLVGDALWPLRLPIGRPPAGLVARNWPSIVVHIRNWRAVRSGRVIWESTAYRATGEAVEMPAVWEISNAREWVEASASRSVSAECKALDHILRTCDPLFHSLLVRQRSLWNEKPLAEVCQAAELALLLEPGCARGAPLRALSLAGIDTKFFERHRSLLVRFLDLRFDGEVNRQGLETFLDAWQEKDHWLLVADLDGGLLPFSQMRVRSSELFGADLAVPNLLVVENENCLHLLPRPLPGTITVLGAGNNLQWLSAEWVQRCRVAYWGDIDTWGLALLARARSMAPQLTALLMTREVFDAHAARHAVVESVMAGPEPAASLAPCEEELYRHLLICEKGRVEQEFISREGVFSCLELWVSA